MTLLGHRSWYSTAYMHGSMKIKLVLYSIYIYIYSASSSSSTAGSAGSVGSVGNTIYMHVVVWRWLVYIALVAAVAQLVVLGVGSTIDRVYREELETEVIHVMFYNKVYM